MTVTGDGSLSHSLVHAWPSYAAYARWLALGVICIAQLMVVLDLTVMNIALPSAQRPRRKDRANALGIFGAIAAGGGAIGLVLGGALTDYLS